MAFRFGPFRLDPDTGELTREGRPIELQPLGHELLELLLHNPGTLFRREELQSALWPDTHVGDDALTMLVSRTRKALGDKGVIETVPRRGYRLALPVFEEEDPIPGPTPLPTTRSVTVRPPPDRFVGRADALSDLERRVEAGDRWVTIVGPGGAGKTRLTLEWLARRGAGRFVDCRATTDRDGLARQVAAHLGIAPGGSPEAVVGLALSALGPELLVLDNLEQVSGAESTLSSWLSDAPALCVVATSRVVLGARGETVLPLEPLPAVEARELFLARDPTRTDDPDLDALIEAVDRLPLALELLAPRSRLLTARRLLDLLDDRLALLRTRGTQRPERHRSLQAVLDDSWVLLDDDQRADLVQLATFHTPLSLDDVERVLPEPALERLQTLVDHSLVHPRPDDRFALLLTVRDYVLEQADPEVADRARSVHAQHLARLGADDMRRQMQAAPSGPVARTAEAALPDLLAAFNHGCDTQDAALARPLALAAWQVLRRTGPLDRASRLLDRALALGDAHWTLLHAAGQAAQLAARWDRSLALNQSLLQQALDRGDALQQTIAHIQLVHHHDATGNLSEAQEHAQGALAASQEAKNLFYEGVVQSLLAALSRRVGAPDRAADHAEHAARLYAQLPEMGLEAIRLATLGIAHRDRGHYSQAIDRLRQAMALYEDQADRFRIVETARLMARTQRDAGDLDDGLTTAVLALDHARKLGNPNILARTLSLAGTLAAAVDDPRAEPWLAEAHGLAERLQISLTVPAGA